MDITTLVRALTPLAAAFEVFGIPYHLTGSLAFSVYVRTQVVQGIEVVADIKFSQVQSLVVQLEKLYDVTEIAIREAIEHRGTFTLVHHDTMQKIDVLLPAYRAYSQVRQNKAQRYPLEQGSRSFRIASPEDMVLMLLEQYKGGGHLIRSVWDTTLVILRAQGKQLDLTYLRVWATALNVASLLEQALVSAGLSQA
jgi:acetolactate synthase regulatory subunit